MNVVSHHNGGPPGTVTPVISTRPDYRFPWHVRLFFWNQKRRYGAVLESARLWGRTPRVFTALALLYGALDRRSSPIEPGLRTLIAVRVSQINGCAFCVDLNAAIGLRRGGESEELLTLPSFAESSVFTDREKAALSYAESVTYSDRHPTDSQFEQLRRHFDDDAIVELTSLIAFQNLSSKFNASLRVAAQGFCPTATEPLADPSRGRDHE